MAYQQKYPPRSVTSTNHRTGICRSLFGDQLIAGERQTGGLIARDGLEPRRDGSGPETKIIQGLLIHFNPPPAKVVQKWTFDTNYSCFKFRQCWDNLSHVRPPLPHHCPTTAPRITLIIPANTGHSTNAVSMLAHRLRRWPNIETTLGECPVFAGMHQEDNKSSVLMNIPRICTTIHAINNNSKSYPRIRRLREFS